MASASKDDSDVFVSLEHEIDSMDPSITDGFHIIYDREVPFEIRYQESSESESDSAAPARTIEAIKVKILILGEDTHPQKIRIEMCSEADLFFYYMHVIDEDSFLLMQEQQRLMIEFSEYTNVLIRLLNDCIKDSHAFLAFLILQGENAARVDIIQNMEYKLVELLSCQFCRSSEDVIQHQITYRYNAMKQRLNLTQRRLQETTNLVRVKNPSLLQQLSKSTTTSPTFTNSTTFF